MNQDDPNELRFRSWFENDLVQSFLQRHGLATSDGIPLRKEEVEKRLKQIDDQSSLDLIAQSVIEKALGIERPLKSSNKHTATRKSKKSIEQNPYVTIYDNSCAITLIYCGSVRSRDETPHAFKVQHDEIIIMQYQTNDGLIMVYKSFLKPNDELTFKSHRLLDTPFTIAIYINGMIDSRISTCCEQGYLKQYDLQSKRSLFQLLFVSGGIPCYTCQMNDLLESSISDNEETKSELFSIVSSSPKILTCSSTSFRTVSHTSETHFTNQLNIKSDSKLSNVSAAFAKTSTISSNSITMEMEIPSTVIEKKLTTTERLQAKANEIQTSTTIEDKLFNQMNGMIKQNQNDLILMKISNEVEEEGQELIPSIANHEMQQLLSKYLLLLLSSLKIHVNNNTTIPVVMTTPVTSIQESPKNVETFVLIWLDVPINMNKDIINVQTKLRAIINSLFIFHKIDETISFIKTIKEEKVFLIISGSLGWDLITKTDMNELSQLDSIYIFCRNKSKYKILMEQNYKVRGVFTHLDPLYTRLKQDTKQILNDLLPISIAPNILNKDQSIIDNQNQVTFLCTQLHHELLFTMEYPDDARLNLVQFCIKVYQDNDTELKFIKEFQNEYHPDKAVWWYTRSTFLYKMLNTAFIRQDIPILYKFHFFIKDLHMQLEQLHSLYKPSLESRVFTVYRGLGMSMKVFNETIRQKVNNLLSFNTFLLTNLNKDIALEFARNKSNGDDESILLQIEIDTDKLQHPFADISYSSRFKRKDEILFSIGTIFRIDYVAEEKTNDGIWLVHLSSIEKNDKQFKYQTKQIQLILLNFFKRVWQAQINYGNQVRIAISYINMASIYYKQGKYQISLDLYKKALENLYESSSSNPLTIATYQTNIAMVYMALEQTNNALKLYEQVLKSRIEFCEPNDLLLINTLHTIGHIYCENKEFDKALQYYHKSLELQSISLSESPLKHNSSLIAAAAHINIALVYYQKNMISKALNHFLKALEYHREYLSKYHPILAFLYNYIGAVYYRLKKFDLALKNQLLTLQIEEYSLSKEHKTLVTTYINIAKTYEQLKKYDEAIDYTQKVLNQLKRHQSEENSNDIQIKQAYLNRLLLDKTKFQEQ